jgi:hypothetical protein
MWEVSYESVSSLPIGTTLRAVSFAVKQLGYHPCRRSPFFSPEDCLPYCWFDSNDYRSFAGVYLHVEHTESGTVVYTRTNEGRSYYDRQHQNATIRTLRRLFGGSFVTDFGRNRYFPDDGCPEEPDQAGCHLAFQRFGRSVLRADWYLQTRTFPGAEQRELYKLVPDQDPRLLSCHLLLPYLVAVFEAYLRDTFVALLRYSSAKEKVLKGARLSAKHLREISEGATSVEDAFAQTLSFQNVTAAAESLSLIDKRIDLLAQFRKPFRRRKRNLVETLEEMIARRHAFVHRSEFGFDLDEQMVWRLLDDLEFSVDRFYRHLTKLRGWAYDKGWGRPTGSQRRLHLPPNATSDRANDAGRDAGIPNTR